MKAKLTITDLGGLSEILDNFDDDTVIEFAATLKGVEPHVLDVDEAYNIIEESDEVFILSLDQN